MTPRIVQVDLTLLQDEGVLMAANERFFWPLGLALTWARTDGVATDLHVTEWAFPDGHHEAIELEAGDPVAVDRRSRFVVWSKARIEALPPAERAGARKVSA